MILFNSIFNLFITPNLRNIDDIIDLSINYFTLVCNLIILICKISIILSSCFYFSYHCLFGEIIMLYFRGCTARERLNNISESNKKILNISYINFETLNDEKCCAFVLLRTGFKKEGIEHMEKNGKKLKDEKIIVFCA